MSDSLEYLELMPDELLASDTFLASWGEWLQHRKEVRKRLTPLAAKKQLELLSKFSSEVAIAMIDRSIMSSWQGVFELPSNHPLLEGGQPLKNPSLSSGNDLKPIR